MKRLLTFLLLGCPLIPAQAATQSDNASSPYTADFNTEGKTSGLAQGWRLQVSEGEVSPALQNIGDGTSQTVSFQERATATLLSEMIPVKPGENYVLHFRARREGRFTYFLRPLFFKSDTWDKPVEGDKQTVNDPQWKDYRLPVTVPEGRHFLVIQAWIVGDAGTAWLDDVQLTPAPEAAATDTVDTAIAPALPAFGPAPAPLPTDTTPAVEPPAKGYGVAMHNGVPTVFCDGEPLFIQAFHNCTWNYKASVGPLSQEMSGAGVHVHMLQTALDWGEEFASGGVGLYGTARNTLDKRIEAILAMDPQARFILNVHCFIPDTWYDKYPDEMVQAEDGTLVKFRPGAKRGFNSWASPKWREEINRRIASLIGHLKTRPYYDHIVGMQSFAGWEGQWTWPRPHRDAYDDDATVNRLNQLTADYSPAMVNYFRAWCRQHYSGDLAKLRAAWDQPEVTFDTIAVPSQDLIAESDLYEFKDPSNPRTRYVADYFEAFTDCRVEAVLEFAHTVKEQTRESPILSGAYFGAVLFAHIGGTKNVQRELHGYTRRFYESPDLDYFTSPPHHYVHEVGGAAVMHLVVDTMLRHGKFVILENDIPTHLRKERRHQFNQPGAVAKDLSESIAIVERSFAFVVTRGLGVWWWDEEMDQETGEPVWYSDPALFETLAETTRIGTEALDWDRSSASEVAVIYSEDANLYLQSTARGIGRDLLMEQVLPLMKLGAPVEFYELTDLDNIPPRKLYVFWNVFHVPADERDALRDAVRRNHATALWVYAPGFVSDTELSADNITALTGITTRLDNRKGVLDTRISNSAHPLSKPLFGETVGSMRTDEFSERRRETDEIATYRTISGAATTAANQKREQTDVIGPHFVIDDPQATVLGRSTETGAPTLAIKKYADWTSVYAAFYPVNAPLLREIAREAGVNIYDEAGDIVYADASLLGIHAATPGTRTIRLPEPADVVDLFSGETVAQDATAFEMDVTEPVTRLYRIQPSTKD
ncbi:MAG: hypothetical protein Q7Q73_04580 [Verrucomicrobiota bacterium JB024]|nr:hypothetical protein [Verrucomicrobiota bacterium JB024]